MTWVPVFSHHHRQQAASTTRAAAAAPQTRCCVARQWQRHSRGHATAAAAATTSACILALPPPLPLPPPPLSPPLFAARCCAPLSMAAALLHAFVVQRRCILLDLIIDHLCALELRLRRAVGGSLVLCNVKCKNALGRYACMQTAKLALSMSQQQPESHSHTPCQQWCHSQRRQVALRELHCTNIGSHLLEVVQALEVVLPEVTALLASLCLSLLQAPPSPPTAAAQTADLSMLDRQQHTCSCCTRCCNYHKLMFASSAAHEA
jgi:hypothetical protein